MSRADRFEFTLDEETEKRLYELLTDMDTRKTDRFWITDKRGYNAEYVKVIRCKDCKWFDMSDPSGTVEPIGYRCKKVNRLWREPDDFCKWAERKEE